MKRLSKSKFARYCQCAKNMWLGAYRPELEVIDSSTESRFETGKDVGDLAKGLLGDYVEATVEKDGCLDIKAMMLRTQELMAQGTENICEAAFSYEGNYCAVDILHRENGGWAIYEVKSTSFPEFGGEPAKLEKYVPDISYQRWVLEQCGVNVKGTYLVCLNSNYVREGELDLQKLFVINDMEPMLVDGSKIGQASQEALDVLNQEKEPEVELSRNCNAPYKCGFMKYCMRNIPSPSVFDLYRLTFEKKLAYYQGGKVTYEDIKDEKLTPVRRIQVDSVLGHTPHIDKEVIKVFLDKLSYPLYFLDFETMQPAIPLFDCTKPYQQVPFQYSLHIIEEEGGELLHKEHLGVSGTDTRRALAEQLCEDIPMDVCVLAYNKAFECTRIKEMAEAFPDLAEHLMNIQTNIVDLMIPFQQGAYYLPSMGGSFSIKVVLPALFPDDPSLDYHNLEGGVQNGTEAMSIFPEIQHMEPEEQQKTRKALLEYCCLDTFAMVKVWQKLCEVV